MLILCVIAANSTLAASKDDTALIEQIKTKNNANWNKIYSNINYSYLSTTTIRAWIGSDTAHPVFTGNASGVVRFVHGKSTSNVTIELKSSSVPSQVGEAANKAKERQDRTIESFVYPPFMNNVLNVYKLKPAGEERIDNYDCYVFLFYPTTYHRGYMTGKVWIDKDSLMMVRYLGTPLIPPPFVSSGNVRQDFFYDKGHDAWFSDKLYIQGTVNILLLTINGYINSTQTDYKFDII
jgi:negative regulator of sigma E activity